MCDRFLSFPGYKILRRDREGRRGGGVAMLLRTECRAQELVMPNGGPLETLWASVSWSGRQPITIGAIYRPPASPIGASLDHLGQQLQAARCFNRPVYLLGDVNPQRAGGRIFTDPQLQHRPGRAGHGTAGAAADSPPSGADGAGPRDYGPDRAGAGGRGHHRHHQ